MANSIDISYSNGIYTVRRGITRVGQGRSLETALENAVGSELPPEMRFNAAEVLSDIMGPRTETHGQVATRSPGD